MYRLWLERDLFSIDQLACDYISSFVASRHRGSIEQTYSADSVCLINLSNNHKPKRKDYIHPHEERTTKPGTSSPLYEEHEHPDRDPIGCQLKGAKDQRHWA